MMNQARIAESKISKLRHSLAKGEDVSVTEIVDALREQHRYIELVERECERVSIQVNRRRFHSF